MPMPTLKNHRVIGPLWFLPNLEASRRPAFCFSSAFESYRRRLKQKRSVFDQWTFVLLYVSRVFHGHDQESLHCGFSPKPFPA